MPAIKLLQSAKHTYIQFCCVSDHLPRYYLSCFCYTIQIDVVVFAAYNQWMKEHGGVIVNIIADMWKGFPGMRYILTKV